MSSTTKEIYISTELDDPKAALEEGKKTAGIRADVEFTLEQVVGKKWKVIIESNQDINFGRIIRSTRGVDLIDILKA